jgi:hypothetical protein
LILSIIIMYFTIDRLNFPFFCLSLFLEIGLKHAWTVYLVLSDVLCTFGCTLYFHFWKYKVHRKVHHCVGINIFSTGNKKRVPSTSESTFMYFRIYFVLSIVRFTFKCTLKSTSQNSWKITICMEHHYHANVRIPTYFLPYSTSIRSLSKCQLCLEVAPYFYIVSTCLSFTILA